MLKCMLLLQLADEAVCIGGPPSSESYLNIPNIIAAAMSRGADAVHPVRGVLSHVHASLLHALGAVKGAAQHAHVWASCHEEMVYVHAPPVAEHVLGIVGPLSCLRTSKGFKQREASHWGVPKA